MDSVIVTLRGRASEPRLADLLSAAQIHRPPEQRAERGPSLAEDYRVRTDLELWGYEDAGALLGVAGIEPAHREGVMLRDLAVGEEVQGRGIGRALVHFVRERDPGRPLLGDTTAAAVGFYRRIGCEVTEEGLLPDGQRVYRFRLPPLSAT